MTFNDLMHPRNIYRNPPDFQQLALDFPEFRNFVVRKGSKISIDFKDPCALRSLTKTLLKKDFDLKVNVPENCLIPTVPQRLNYILWVEDLIRKLDLNQTVIKGIDIGTGPCCIFPLLGVKRNGWNFIATELVQESFRCAQQNVELNNLQDKIIVRKVEKDTILKELITESERYDFCLCNPPFFRNFEELQRKKKLPHDAKLQEVIVDGGEVEFVERIISESMIVKENVKIYTSMLGRKQSLQCLLKRLPTIEGINYTSTEFGQGNTVRWGIAWTFLSVPDFTVIYPKKSKQKVKPAFSFIISQVDSANLFGIQEAVQKIESILKEFQVPYQILSLVDTSAHMEITAHQNTWINQRRKRREMLRRKTEILDSVSDTCTKLVSSSEVCKKNYVAPKILNSSTSLDTENDVLQSMSYLNCKTSHEHRKRKIEENNICENGQIKYIKRDTSDNIPSRIINETNEPLLNCELLLSMCEENIMLQFSCCQTANRETMHQIYQLLKKRLTQL